MVSARCFRSEYEEHRVDFKNLAGKAMDLAAQNADKVDAVIDKAGDLVDEKTGGKFAGQVDAAQDAAKNAIRKEG
ncbi:antitoxin [Nocardia farcinica]|uniref:Antitoxin Rv0909/MT0933 n=1 Tax=Nocardia farcinica (strain IFM 10152) TaxID=247156 RepID=Q5Z218_NOCFA|nr:antitoxin [Nocardia farcinica]BAD55523.1 hypothetical protein NFA_6780 [Nocardia farcinica IFM 10152]MBC9819596.1 antitoxin [Nocardia farcinica]MBF6233540.1 antitoxin [Nocardia farcinica]MBF6257789.1 antitoxin [Nocardia farcinica]